MIVRRLKRDDLIKLVNNIFYPTEGEFTAEAMDEQLLVFCLNCPDPGAAMDLVLEAPRGSSVIDVVDQALNLSRRSVKTLSEAELSMDHPLRHWRLQESAN